MSDLQITAGFLKGRKIPLPAAIKGHRQVTPQKVKEALFQILANRVQQLENTLFCDLFAGSGQIGFEAASRGFGQVILCEIDAQRCRDLRHIRDSFGLEHNTKIIRGDGFKFFPKLLSAGPTTNTMQNLVVFADPPYTMGRDKLPPWQKITGIVEKTELSQNLLLVLQAPREQSQLYPEARCYYYGKNCLLVLNKGEFA